MDPNTPRGGTLTPDSPGAAPEAAPPVSSAPPVHVPPHYPLPNYGSPMTPPGMAPRYPPYPYDPYDPYAYGYPPRERRARRGWLIGGIISLVFFALFLALIVGLIAFVVNLAGPTYSRTATQTFTVTGVPIVNVYDTAGSVTIRQGNVGQVTVQITNNIRTLDNTGAQRALSANAIAATQSGNAIAIDGHFTTRWQDGVWYSRTMDMTLIVPASANAKVHVDAGAVNLANVSGVLTVETNAGMVSATNVTLGDGSTVTTNAGAISLSGTLAPNADVRIVDNAGSVTLRLPADTPARLDASVNVGSIAVTGWPIPVSRPSTVGAAASGNLGTSPTGTIHVTVNVGNLSLIAQ